MEEDIKILEELKKDFISLISKRNCFVIERDKREKEVRALENLLTRYKQLEEENKELQKSVDQIYDDYQDIGKMYFNLTEKIENKIDKFDYEFEKAKRKNDKDRADYYWDLIINFKKLLEMSREDEFKRFN